MRFGLTPLLVLVLAVPLAAQSSARINPNAMRQLNAIGKDLASLSEAHAGYESAARAITDQRDRLGKMVAALAASERGRTKEVEALVLELAKMNDQFAELRKTASAENRRFQDLSKASRARHEAAMNSIRNMR